MKEPFARNDVKIAVIGGGTGSFTLLSSLKYQTKQLAALVNMADDGGSTGILRDELGALPPGDVRQCLVALSQSPKVRDLFNYRFDGGSLTGHAFGNLFLTALEKMTGNFAEGIELAGEVLNIVGTVEPITLTDVTLVLDEGLPTELKGEFVISQAHFKEKPDLSLVPLPTANPRAIRAIETADMVVIAPGSLYGSLAPALIVPGVGEALQRTKAFKVYVCNLVGKPGQTDSYKVHDFADEIERLAGGEFLDAVLYNAEKPSSKLLKKYARSGGLPVEWDEAMLRSAHYIGKGANLLAGQIWQGGSSSDPLAAHRTLIRHDSHAVSRALMELYHGYRQD